VRRWLVVAVALAALFAVAAPAASAQRPRWDIRLLAKVPTPGFPAFAYVHPNGRIYVGTYVNPKGDSVRSIVREYRGSDGLFLRQWAVPGQDLAGEHGVQVATSDSKGRLVLLDHTPARALKLDRGTGAFSQYSTFADLKPCSAGQTGPNCSPTTQDLAPVPNYGAWGPDGSLYVTDYQQGVIWRVPPGGGAAKVWLSDARLDGGQFGTTGLLLGADRRTLFFAQGSSGSPGGILNTVNGTTGKLYSVPIQPNGTPGGLKQIWESGPADLPDGFAIAKSGRFYVPLAGGANQIAEVAPDGRELERHSSDSFDTPSSARFLGTRLIVPNQAYLSGDQTKMTLLDVEVGEAGLPELIPGLDNTPPVISRLSFKPKRFHLKRRGRRRAGTRIRFRLSEAATVTFNIDRRRGKRWVHRLAFTRKRKGGRSSIRFAGRVRVRKKLYKLKPGSYRLVLSADDAAGNHAKRVSKRFRAVR
jgi:sugar lactone lactonase YvrE